MKKRFCFVLIALIMLLGAVSCGGDGGDGEGSGKRVTVTFDTAGSNDVFEPQVLEVGSKISRPYPPFKKGYSFFGWFYEGEPWNFNNAVTEDMTIEAKFNPIDYKITYLMDGGELPEGLPSSYNADSGDILLGTPRRGDSTFGGWTVNGVSTDRIKGGSTGEVVVEANFYDFLPEIVSVSGGAEGAVAYGDMLEEKIVIQLCGIGDAEATLRIEAPELWHTLRVAQGTRITYVKAKTENGREYVEFLGSEGNITVTPAIYSNDLILESSFGTTLANGKVLDKNYYPGFVRKAVTFTIDDGNVENDKTFIDIVKPAGILGTFNLINAENRRGGLSPDEYVALYEGFEVANHHNLHPTPWRDGFDYSTIEFKDEVFNSQTADVRYIYKHATVEGLYYIDWKQYSPTTKSPYWHPLATNETYTKYVDITKEQIERVFGEGAVVGFVYPHGVLNEHIKKYLEDAGYLYARKSGNLLDKTGFALPDDRFAWTYNASVGNLLQTMKKFDVLQDDGNLKFFAFGVHSSDFVDQWEVLEEFAALYGNRPQDFYYASNRDIFEYEDAINALQIFEDKIVNPSDVAVFVTVDGVKTIIGAGESYYFE